MKLYNSKAWLQLQRRKGRSSKDIAAECGVSYQMIDRKLREFGIK